MKKGKILKNDYKRYLELLKHNQKIFEVDKKSKVNTNEIRLLNTAFPTYFLTVKKTYKLKCDNIYKVIPLTEFIALAYTENILVFNVDRMSLCLTILPFYLDISEDFLYNYTEVIAKTNEKSIKACINFIENTKKVYSLTQNKFIEKEKERLGKISLYSIISVLNKIENV